MNMQLWQQILTLTLTPVIIVGVLAYLFKSLLKSRLDKDLERYKSDLKSILDKDIEKFKSELAIQQVQFQTRFSLIHQKRAEVLGELYSRLDSFDRAFADLIAPLQYVGDISLQDKKTATCTKGNEFIEYYSAKKIYLDESLCNQIEEIQKILKDAWVAFDISQRGKSDQEDKTGLRKLSSKLVEEKLPPLKKQLEERFRKELGSIDGK
jgi:hypothetical protein